MPAPPVLELDVSLGASRGRESAPVSVVEWADFECPHCGHLWAAIEEALKPYGDRVRYVFLNFPMPSHEFAQKAAEAAAAARAQGRFFEYAGILFRNQKALDVPSLKKYAALAGLDPARFSLDLDGGRFAAEVFLERKSGLRAGVLGTPSIFVNGVWLRWDRTGIPDLRAAVDEALARAVPGAER
jgi:protein-disulfide isomerase